MTHRERVQCALAHRTPDRCPLQVSFTPEFALRLREDLAEKGKMVSVGRREKVSGGHNPHGGGNPYDLERAVGSDMLLTSVGWANSYYQEGDSYTDEWGIGWKSVHYDTPYGRGRYTEIADHPLSEERAIDRYDPPDPGRGELYREAERVVARIGVDMIRTGDDVGGQQGMVISPAHWRRFLKPRMTGFIERVKAVNPRIKVAYHSDGDILPIIPELIEIGLDVLNPVQPARMDPARLKDAFGDRLCFWGSKDEQRTLPFGTPEDVQKEVRLRLVTPMENFRAMVDTVMHGS